MSSIEIVKRVQARLKALGYDPGPVDGLLGPLTRGALRAYQSDKGLAVKWPGTLGPTTIKALLGGSNDEMEEAASTNVVARPWYTLALSKKGLHEGKDNAELRAFLRSDGATLGDPAQLPWCGDFVETCIARTLPDEPLPANPYLARNWGPPKFGVECEPQLGAIARFWRGAKSGVSGHVGFVAGAGPGVLYILGGNQSNAVTVAKLGIDRLLGTSWPRTADMPSKIVLPTMVGGKLSTNEA